MNEIHPAPLEFSAEALATDPILHFFHYSHLPPKLQSASAPFCGLALHIVCSLPRNAERTVALRKLLEAKDAAVRANVSTPKDDLSLASTNSGMPSFLTRLIAEHSDLDDKMIKLRSFIGSPAFVALDEANRSLLTRQEELMSDYRETLDTRITIARDKLGRQDLDEGEVVEIGGHDIDRDGPVSFTS